MADPVLVSQSIGPFSGASAHAAHGGDAVACLADELPAYAARFGVDASGVLCAILDAPAISDAFPALRVEPRASFAGGVLYLTRFAE